MSIEKEPEQYPGRLGKPMTDKQEYIERMRAKDEAYAQSLQQGHSRFEAKVVQQQGPTHFEMHDQHTASIQDLYKRISAVETETRRQTSVGTPSLLDRMIVLEEGLTSLESQVSRMDSSFDRRLNELESDHLATDAMTCIEALEGDIIRHLRRIEVLEIGAPAWGSSQRQKERLDAIQKDIDRLEWHTYTTDDREGILGRLSNIEKRIGPDASAAIQPGDVFTVAGKAVINPPGKEAQPQGVLTGTSVLTPEGSKALTLEECVDWIWNNTSWESWPAHWKTGHSEQWSIVATRKALGK